jgi:hypothetical protein
VDYGYQGDQYIYISHDLLQLRKEVNSLEDDLLVDECLYATEQFPNNEVKMIATHFKITGMLDDELRARLEGFFILCYSQYVLRDDGVILEQKGK